MFLQRCRQCFEVSKWEWTHQQTAAQLLEWSGKYGRRRRLCFCVEMNTRNCKQRITSPTILTKELTAAAVAAKGELGQNGAVEQLIITISSRMRVTAAHTKGVSHTGTKIFYDPPKFKCARFVAYHLNLCWIHRQKSDFFTSFTIRAFNR